MPRPKKENGESSIYFGADAWWHGRVTVGLKPNGDLDRRHVRGRTEDEVKEKVDKLEAMREAAKVPAPGHTPTVAEWMRTWLDTIAPRTAQQTTVDEIYRPKVERWIIPGLGKHRLDRLQPGHIDDFYSSISRAGLSTKSVLLIHQILSRALKMAMRQERVMRNVASLVATPTHRDQDVEPFSDSEAREILKLANVMRNGARWSVALALGLRQCEALGLRWSCIDFKTGTMRVFQIKRARYQHGCDNPHSCGAKWHKRACETPCKKHTKRCPKPCEKRCTFHANHCPKRIGGKWEFKEPKGGKARTIAIPRPLLEQLQKAKKLQTKERETAGESWEDWGLCFPNSLGKPMEPRDDWADWKWLCKAAAVRGARLHDARHTAATLLLEQGVDIRVVQEILGHSTLNVTLRYTHVTSRLAREAADRMGNALWS